jgi:formylglycine-generating enzyme required for sulfatase activity
MSNPAYYDAIERFVNHLESSGLKKRLDLNDEDIADTLWLALQMGVEATQPREEPEKFSQTEVIANHQVTENETSETVQSPINFYTPPPDPQPKKSQNEGNTEGLPFQTPAAPALQNKSQINRALRPFMRKFPSPTRRILDVEATVNRIVDGLIVEQEIWLPVTQPEPERWLNLELVIEENRSSFIWQETINELEEILENYGIFRNVRSWKLSSDNQNNLQLVSRKKRKQKNQRQYSYRELYHSNGRGLILIVTDCISAIWQQETIYNWLEKWSNQSPIAIMQLFPERLWLSTELGLGYKVKLSALNPGVPNSQLIGGKDLDIEKALNLPIITLEPEYLKAWAKVVAGYGKSQTPAIVLDLDFVKEQVQETSTTQSLQASPETIVDRFLATASPTAQHLAGLMAAVPVSLPVVHLIQNTMLPKSTPVNVAEVFLSGMIERKKDVKNQELYEYDFVAEVRKLLNQAMPIGETEKVLDVVSEYITEKMGRSIKSFTALLSRLSDLSQENQKNLLPFAHVAVEVLSNLGGEYAEFAKQVHQSQLSIVVNNENQVFFQQFAGEYICAVKWGGETGTWNEGLENLLISLQGEVQLRSRSGLAVIENLTIAKETISWSFDDNESAASITFKINSEDNYFWEQHQTGKLFEGWLEYPNEGRIDFRGRFEVVLFPPLSEFTFKVKTISILPTFDFEVATIELKKPRFNIGKPQLNIKRQPQQADYWPEKLGDNLTLEMVSIPGGTFIMGSPLKELEHKEDESPQHSVTVQPFFMGKYQVTQAQWRFVAQLPQVNKELKLDPSIFKGDNRPVEQVSWKDAVEFCDRLSQYTGRTYRLPSEAEWEYACRAGTTTPFHFGETITTDLANYNGNQTYGQGSKGVYRQETTKVGSFGVANNFGLYDMHGNVWEWCQDHWHSNYEDAPTDGSAWLDIEKSNNIRLLRGGSWYNVPVFCRSAYRFNGYLDAFSYDIGFRVVCSGAART